MARADIEAIGYAWLPFRGLPTGRSKFPLGWRTRAVHGAADTHLPALLGLTDRGCVVVSHSRVLANLDGLAP